MVVQRIESETAASGKVSDDMRYAVLMNLIYSDLEYQVELETQWKAKAMDSYIRACKAAFASRE